MAIVGPPTYPAPIQQIFIGFSEISRSRMNIKEKNDQNPVTIRPERDQPARFANSRTVFANRFPASFNSGCESEAKLKRMKFERLLSPMQRSPGPYSNKFSL